MRYFFEDNKRPLIMLAVAIFILIIGTGFKSMYYGVYQSKEDAYKEEVSKLQNDRDLINAEITKTTEKVEKDNMAITEDSLKKHGEIAEKYFSPSYVWNSKDEYDKAMKSGEEQFKDQKKAFDERFKVKSADIDKKKQKSAVKSVTLYPRKVEGGTVLYYTKIVVERTELEGAASEVETLISFSVNADGDVARVKMLY